MCSSGCSVVAARFGPPSIYGVFVTVLLNAAFVMPSSSVVNVCLRLKYEIGLSFLTDFSLYCYRANYSCYESDTSDSGILSRKTNSSVSRAVVSRTLM